MIWRLVIMKFEKTASRSLHLHQPRVWLHHTHHLRAAQTLKPTGRVCAVRTHVFLSFKTLFQIFSKRRLGQDPTKLFNFTKCWVCNPTYILLNYHIIKRSSETDLTFSDDLCFIPSNKYNGLKTGFLLLVQYPTKSILKRTLPS